MTLAKPLRNGPRILDAVSKQRHRRVEGLLGKLDEETLQIMVEKGVSETIEWIWNKYQEEKRMREKLENLCKMLERENKKVWQLNGKTNSETSAIP